MTEKIIRCENCEYFIKQRSEESARKYGQIYECYKNIFMCPQPHDYCSRAKKACDTALPVDAIPTSKIRDAIAEINEMPKTYPFVNHIDTYVKTADVIKIIGKHTKVGDTDAT